MLNRLVVLIIHHCLIHRGAVLSVVMSSTGEQCFSGGVDGTIQCWNTPNPNIDPYDSYGNSIMRFARVFKFSDWVMVLDLCFLCCRPIDAARSNVRTHRLSLGFGVQQCSPAPPLLLRRRHRETVGHQHHLTRTRCIQWRQKYWLENRIMAFSLSSAGII